MFDWVVSGPTGPNAGVYDATNVTGTGIGGFNDWYIPALNELEILYYNLKPASPSGGNANNTSSGTNLNAVPARPSNYPAGGPPIQTTANGTGITVNFQTGGAQSFDATTAFWTATQISGNPTNVTGQYFDNGAQVSNGKQSTAQYARAIRRVAV